MKKRSIVKDYELAQKTLKGDIKSSEELYDGIDHYLKGFLYKQNQYLHLPIFELEELIIDIITKSYQKLRSYDGTCLFSTWVCSLAFYTVLQYKDQKRKYYDHNLMYEDFFYFQNNDMIQYLIEEEVIKTMEFSFEHLEQQLKEILKLKIFEYYTFREISELLQLSQSTVYYRYRKACKELKRIFLEDYEYKPSILIERN